MLLCLGLIAGACSRSDSDDAGPADESTTTTAAKTASADFGTLKDVCGPAPSGETNTASDQGVTADEIEIGTISDPGFAGRPGLNQELFDASHVFEDWCNAAGGINGRKIKVVERDAKLTEYKQRITEACASDFFLVGGGAVFDDTGQNERLSCLLPDVPAYLVSPTARGADLEAPPLPSALDEISVGVYQ
jgi:hypothetical protein